MSRFLFTVLGTAVLLGALSPLALAGEPDGNATDCDLILAVSPKNNLGTLPAQFRYTYKCILKDSGGQLVSGYAGSRIKLDFTGCAGTNSCPNTIASDTPSSGLDGVVAWTNNLNCGGALVCGVNILKDDVLFINESNGGPQDHAGLPNASVDGGRRSPDEDGSGTVALPDVTIFKNEFNNTGTRRDYQGDVAPPHDGLTTLPDVTCFKAHFNAT